MNRDLFRLDEISIRGLCMELLGNLWMILLAGLSMFFLATGWHNLTYQPQYTSSATLVVTLKGEENTYSSLSLASQMADVFSQVFASDALRQKISEDTGENIAGTITCAPVTETNLMTLSAACDSPREAYLYINSALRNYEAVAGDVFSNSSLQIVQDPQVPEGPSNTSWAMTYRWILTLAANLALAMVEKHRKVLLIDGDLLKPAMHKIFEEQKDGHAALSEVLAGTVPVKEAPWFDSKHRIYELFQYRGMKHTAKVLDSGRLEKALEIWKNQVDYVIVDCSPMAVSTDAEVWMNVVDSVLLVVREDRADVRMINDTVDRIWESGKDFSGFVLNAFHRKPVGGKSQTKEV